MNDLEKRPRYWLDGQVAPGVWGVVDKEKGGIEWHFTDEAQAREFTTQKLREDYIERFAGVIAEACGEDEHSLGVHLAESWWDDFANRENPQPEEDAHVEMSYWEP